ncbi:MAG: outer membrane protein assembly factor BamA [Candidatus Aegiribacteria sp.]|nr:outer membrane protein assembly factor BamA [Candidatus Aegiribacteria sp.]
MRFSTALLAIVISASLALEIGSVEVIGNSFVSSDLITRVFGLETGDVYNPAAVSRGTRDLFGLGYFSNIEIQADTAGGVADLLIVVNENRLLSRIEFSNPGCLDEDDVLDSLSLFPGQTVSPGQVEEARTVVLHFYAEDHRHEALVTPIWLDPDSDNRSVLLFECEEGPNIRVGEINFSGNTAFNDGKLRGQMDTRQDSFWRSGRYRKNEFEAGLDSVIVFYQDHGYPEARILDVEQSMLEDGRHLRFEITLEEGGYYTFGDISFSGNEAFSDSILVSVMDMKPGDEYSRKKLHSSLMTLYELFQERGYFYAGIDPVVTAGDPDNTLDIAYIVNEGERAHVRRIEITGNNRTLENIIRRQLTVYPGDMFQRSALMRSYRNIYYLNYFSNVGVDFRYLEDSPDVDIVFDVEEKTTGKAGIGAAYGGGTGFSGFVELGETNLFGRGQHLNFNYQFSKTQQDIHISFTEPWFRDTPLSLGGEIFHTTYNESEYDRRRTGGAVTVGRPIPWVDYSSASIKYSLEKVNVFNITSDTTSYYYSLRDIDWPRWTSSVRLNFTRDSRDRQMFASRGSLNSLTGEFAGGVLGGNIGFQKYLIDSSWHVPSFWRFIFFLRARVGMVASLDGREPPAYELFELGGTGFYGVRGYPSNSITGRTGYEKVGGRSMLILTAEYRCRIIDQLQLAVFADAGNTWDSWSSSDFSDLNRGAGIGIRIEVPMLGVIGFDYAYSLDGSERGWEPHFQFGTIF